MTCGSPNQTLCLIGTSKQKTEQCVLEMSWQRLEECGNKLFPHQHWSGGVGVGGAEGLGGLGDECQSLSVTFTLRTSLLDVLGRPYMMSCKVF